MFECIKGFSLEKCDDDGFNIDGEFESIEKGSFWTIPEDKDYRLIGGEVRLEKVKNGEMVWIEISKKTFEKNFCKTIDKEKQEFQLGDTAYMIDEDYRFFESTVNRIGLYDNKYYYETSDVDFENGDIGEWVFKSEKEREMSILND